MMKCPKCNTNNKEKSKFCTKCGYSFNNYQFWIIFLSIIIVGIVLLILGSRPINKPLLTVGILSLLIDLVLCVKKIVDTKDYKALIIITVIGLILLITVPIYIIDGIERKGDKISVTGTLNSCVELITSCPG